MDWVRLHTDTLDDRLLRRAARNGASQLHLIPWVWLFAGQADDGGRLTIDGVPADAADVADAIPGTTVTADDVATLLADLEALPDASPHRLVRDADGAYRITGWDVRAGASRSETSEATRERKRAQRQREREAREAAQAGATATGAPDRATPEVDGSPEAESRDESRTVTDGHGVTPVTLTAVTGDGVTVRDMSRPRSRERGRLREVEAGAGTHAPARDREEPVVPTRLEIPDGTRVESTDAHRRWLTAAANNALTAKYGARPTLIVASSKSVYETVDAWVEEGVECWTAAIEIVRVVEASRFAPEDIPTGLAYFAKPVIRAWKRELAARDAATFVAPGQRTAAPTTPASASGLMVGMAVLGASQGDPTWIAYCEREGIVYEKAS
jgi:hypothetical protein